LDRYGKLEAWFRTAECVERKFDRDQLVTRQKGVNKCTVDRRILKYPFVSRKSGHGLIAFGEFNRHDSDRYHSRYRHAVRILIDKKSARMAAGGLKKMFR
jgi:hypothetical protein